MFPYVHQFWVTFAIGAVKQVQDLLFKCFAVFVNCFSGLNRRVVIAWSFIRWWSSYLFGVGKINFFRDNDEPSQNDSHLAATLLPFFLQGVEPRNLAPRKLVVIINEIVRGLCPFAVLMNGLELFALLRVSSGHHSDGGELGGTPIRTAVRPTSFIFVSIVENDCPTDCGEVSSEDPSCLRIAHLETSVQLLHLLGVLSLSHTDALLHLFRLGLDILSHLNQSVDCNFEGSNKWRGAEG